MAAVVMAAVAMAAFVRTSGNWVHRNSWSLLHVLFVPHIITPCLPPVSVCLLRRLDDAMTTGRAVVMRYDNHPIPMTTANPRNLPWQHLRLTRLNLVPWQRPTQYLFINYDSVLTVLQKGGGGEERWRCDCSTTAESYCPWSAHIYRHQNSLVQLVTNLIVLSWYFSTKCRVHG